MEIVSNKPIDPSEVYALIKKQGCGSAVFHFAVVRPSTENKTSNSIEYCANGDVNEELRTICQEVREKWKIEDVLIIRRLGQLDIGDIISLVAVSSPHRQEAFDSCRYGVDRLKKMSTITKKETFV
ncbi:MAG: molybdenum cofactor biosynthesis protein MoaE [Planctomycetota bacterium]|jgi:molybdopterin synthase catalytic subunit